MGNARRMREVRSGTHENAPSIDVVVQTAGVPAASSIFTYKVNNYGLWDYRLVTIPSDSHVRAR